MAKKQPPKEPPKEPLKPALPEDVLENLPLDQLMEMLGTVAGQAKGMAGEDIRKYIATIQQQVSGVQRAVDNDARDDAAKKAAAMQIEEMLETVKQTGTAVGTAIEPYREQIAGAFRRADLQQVGEAMMLIAQYLQSPSEEAKQRAQALVTELEAKLGPLVGYDPEREDAERRAKIRRDVKQQMEAIFAGRPLPKLEFKSPSHEKFMAERRAAEKPSDDSDDDK